MKWSLVALAILSSTACITRNDLGAQIAREEDAGVADAAADADPPEVDDGLTPALVEARMQGSWRGTAAFQRIEGSEMMVSVTFRGDSTFDLRCDMDACNRQSGRWAITDIGPDGKGAGTLEIENSLLPVYIDAVSQVGNELAYTLSNIGPTPMDYRLVRDPAIVSE